MRVGVGQPGQKMFTATEKVCYNAPTLFFFFFFTKEVFNMQVVWHYPITLHTMVHGQVFCIRTHREGSPLFATRGHVEKLFGFEP